MFPTAEDKLHEMFINDAQRKMNDAFMDGDLQAAHEHCNEFGRLIQNRSQEMINFMEKDLGIVNYVSCIESRRVVR